MYHWIVQHAVQGRLLFRRTTWRLVRTYASLLLTLALVLPLTVNYGVLFHKTVIPRISVNYHHSQQQERQQHVNNTRMRMHYSNRTTIRTRPTYTANTSNEAAAAAVASRSDHTANKNRSSHGHSDEKQYNASVATAASPVEAAAAAAAETTTADAQQHQLLNQEQHRGDNEHPHATEIIRPTSTTHVLSTKNDTTWSRHSDDTVVEQQPAFNKTKVNASVSTATAGTTVTTTVSALATLAETMTNAQKLDQEQDRGDGHRPATARPTTTNVPSAKNDTTKTHSVDAVVEQQTFNGTNFTSQQQQQARDDDDDDDDASSEQTPQQQKHQQQQRSRQDSSSSSSSRVDDDFPITRFTSHVQALVALYDFDQLDECNNEFAFGGNTNWPRPTITTDNGAIRNRTSSSSNSTSTAMSSSSWIRPTMEPALVAMIPSCHLKTSPDTPYVNVVSHWWCTLLRQVFAPEKQRTLPGRVSFGVSLGDYVAERHGHACVGSSDQYGGNFSLINFLEVKQMIQGQREFQGEDARPWHERDAIPIWRGSPWINWRKVDLQSRNNNNSSSNDNEANYIKNQVLVASPRLKAIDWSIKNPSLLNARTHNEIGFEREEEAILFGKNSTTGLYSLIENRNFIEREDYYTGYQVALVLCGKGAAFRTSTHLSASTAVVLQECDYHEWFSKRLMVPMKHYIPLAQDLSDLETQMHWIQENPDKVRSIAQQGRQFYLDYLSFEQNEKHIYEFVYRLALAQRQFDKSLTSEQRKERRQRRQDLQAELFETVSRSVPNDDVSGSDTSNELTFMCKDLLSRAGHTSEGQEPWRDHLPGRGLLWNMSDCDDQTGLDGLDELLSQWYTIRAVASAAGIAVEMNCRSPVTDRLQTKVSPYDTTLDGGKFSWKDYCQTCGENCRYGHTATTEGLERVRNVIRGDMRTMAYNVLLSANESVANEVDDVMIHLQVGDVGRQDNGRRPDLVPFMVYKKTIPETAKRIGIVTAGRQGQGQKGSHELSEAITTAARDYLRASFPNATVSIRNNEYETLDFVYMRLIMANLTICSSSTFCMYPAIASHGESYILHSPMFGESDSWINKVANDFSIIHFVEWKQHNDSIFGLDLSKWKATDIVNKLRGES